MRFDVEERYDFRFDDLNEAYVAGFWDSMQNKLYDSLNAMLMVLNSGEVDEIFVHNIVAHYAVDRGFVSEVWNGASLISHGKQC